MCVLVVVAGWEPPVHVEGDTGGTKTHQGSRNLRVFRPLSFVLSALTTIVIAQPTTPPPLPPPLLPLSVKVLVLCAPHSTCDLCLHRGHL